MQIKVSKINENDVVFKHLQSNHPLTSVCKIVLFWDFERKSIEKFASILIGYVFFFIWSKSSISKIFFILQKKWICWPDNISYNSYTALIVLFFSHYETTLTTNGLGTINKTN